MPDFTKRTVFLVGDTQRAYAKKLIDDAPLGWVAKVGEATRTDAQNRLFWPLVGDLRNQVPEHAAFSADDTKLRFLNALGVEMRFLPCLEGAGMFPVGQRSSLLTKSQFSLLCELVFMEGGKRGVEWTHRALDALDQARAA